MPVLIRLPGAGGRRILVERYKIILLFLALFAAAAAASVSVRGDMAFSRLFQGGGGTKCVALTFDDGPHPGYAEKISAILESRGVTATFFVVGRMALKHPELVRLLHDRGNEIGNHTFSHLRLTELSKASIEDELRLANEAIEFSTGRSAFYFRPPGGRIDPGIWSLLHEKKLGVVMWTVNPGDYRGIPASSIADSVMSQVTDGGVILLHSGIPQTLEALPAILDRLKSGGYTVGTVSWLYSRFSPSERNRIARTISIPAGTDEKI